MMIIQHHVKATQKVIILPPLLVKERSPLACMEVADPPREPKNKTNRHNQKVIVHMFVLRGVARQFWDFPVAGP